MSAGRLFRRSRAAEPIPHPLPDEDEAVRAFLYDAEREDGHVSLDEVDVGRLTSEQLLWIDVSSKTDLDSVAPVLGLAADTVRTIREGLPHPAFFAHDGYVHVVIVAPGGSGASDSLVVLDCLVGPNWVLSVHGEPIGFLGRFDERIRSDSALGRLDASGFLAAILHEHVASYLVELRPIEAEVDRLDLRSMAGRVDEEALLHDLVAIRMRLARLRRLLEPHRELYASLGRSEFAVLSGSESASDFVALTELLERVVRSIETAREMIVGSFEIYTTWTAHATNRVMKRLTVASVTLLPPTLLAGVMGMNSLPGTLTVGFAFWLTIAVMAGLALSVVTLAWRREWL
jgi:magnesium transporter